MIRLGKPIGSKECYGIWEEVERIGTAKSGVGFVVLNPDGKAVGYAATPREAWFIVAQALISRSSSRKADQ